MFQAADRVPIVQAMILAEDAEERREHLGRLRPIQEGDFEGIFRAMRGLPVTIRLLDPPLHEFLPSLVDLSVEVDRGRDAAGTWTTTWWPSSSAWCSSARSTRCSAPAGCGSASSGPTSTACRRRRS